MTPRQFDKAVSRTRFHSKAREAAYAVLVRGVSKRQAAMDAGVTRSAVQQWVRRVKALAETGK